MPFSFSPSSLNLLGECERCFWLQFIKGIKRPDGPFPSLPSGMDKILKEHFDRYRDQGELPPELRDLKGVKLFDDKEKLAIWRNNFKGIRWKDEEGNVLHGAVDNLLDDEGKLIVLDYKTRGFPLKDDTAAHYQNQLDTYNFLLRKNEYETEDYAYLLFYYPAHVQPHGDVAFHTQLVKIPTNPHNAEKTFKRALEVLKGKEPKASPQCGFCGWAEKAK